MTGEVKYFQSYETVNSQNWRVRGIDPNKTLKGHRKGDIRIRVQREDGAHYGILQVVLHVPGLEVNLFSVGAAADKGLQIIFSTDSAHVMSGEKLIATGTRIDKALYVLNISTVFPETSINPQIGLFSMTPQTLNIWHRRLAHINPDAIKRMADEQLVRGMNISSSRVDQLCTGCQLGKSHRLPFPKGRE